MTDQEKVFMPSRPLEPGDRYGVLSGFDPGTRTLPTGFQIAPPFRSLPVDIVLDKDIAVTLRDGVTIYVDVLRPTGTEQVPVIVAWSPYGKGQGTSTSVMGIFGLVGLNNKIVSGLESLRVPTQPTGARRATRSAIPTVAASPTRKATASCGIARRAATATT